MLKRLALKYWPMVLLLILIVAVLCMSRYAVNGHQDHQNESDAVNPSASVTRSDGGKGSQKASESEHPPSWIETFTWPNGVTAWALLLTLLVVAWQSTETRDAAKSANAQIQMMKDKERARLDVDFPPGDLELDDGPEWTEAMNAVYAGTKIVVANVGGTNAFNVTAWAQVIGTPNGGALGDRHSLLNIPTVLKPNADPIAVDVITLLKGVNHIAAVKNMSEILHLVGTINYEDIFGEAHEIQFRYLWEVSGMNVEGKSFDLSKWERTAEGNWVT